MRILHAMVLHDPGLGANQEELPESPPVVDELSARHVQWLGQGHPGKRQTAAELHAFLRKYVCHVSMRPK